MPVFNRYEYCYNNPLTYEEIRKNIGKDIPISDFVAELKEYLKQQELSDALIFTNDNILTQNYVGVIKYKNFQFNILPKLIRNADERNIDEIKQKTVIDNLTYMISLTQKLDIKITEHADINQCENPFLEILIREYANSLFSCLKKTTPRNYIREEDNLNYLKGKLQFTENIRYNCANQAKFYCEYDEFSENNKLNQLFLFVSKSLFGISQNSENKKILSFIMNYFCDLPLVPFDKYKAKKIILTRNQQLFEHPFKLAKMFLQNISVDISKNAIENITLLWDMNFLFEEFVYEIIRRCDLGYKVHYQKDEKLLINPENNRRYGNTYVDIYLGNKDNNKDIIILDTKYKVNKGGNSEFENTDIYQICTYCRIHNSNNAILFYPADVDFKSDNGNKYFVQPEAHCYKLNVKSGDTVNIHRIMIKLDEDLKNILNYKNELQDMIKSLEQKLN